MSHWKALTSPIFCIKMSFLFKDLCHENGWVIWTTFAIQSKWLNWIWLFEIFVMLFHQHCFAAFKTFCCTKWNFGTFTKFGFLFCHGFAVKVFWNYLFWFLSIHPWTCPGWPLHSSNVNTKVTDCVSVMDWETIAGV